MGAGSSVVVQQPQVNDEHFKELLSSSKARAELFEKISSYKKGDDDHITLKGKISLKNLVGYFCDKDHALYPGFEVNVDILSEAYKYAAKFKSKKSKKKKKKAKSEEQITLGAFHKFFPALLLYDKLWDIFSAADGQICEDSRVFKGEFMNLYDKLQSMHDVKILGTFTKEDWGKEFDELDKNNDGYIIFHEFCDYAISHIEKPFDFHEVPDEGEESDEESTPVIPTTPTEIATGADGVESREGAKEEALVTKVVAQAVDGSIEEAPSSPPVAGESVSAVSEVAAASVAQEEQK